MTYPNSRSMLGFTSNMQKCNTVSNVLASSQQQAVTRGDVITCCHSDNNHAHLIRLQLEQYINMQYGISVRGSDALFPNESGEDFSLISYSDVFMAKPV